MVDIDIEYLGDLSTEATHGPSGSKLLTDAPVDNQGKGRYFSPTDLVGTSMGTCMLTIMAIAAERKGIELEGTKVHVKKEMVADPQRRIARLSVTFHMPAGIAHDDRVLLERAAAGCPVKRSLDERVDVPLVFDYPD